MHLQWFAAEDEGRTEEPSEQKIKKARSEGKVAKSVEFPSALVLLLGVIAITVLGSNIISINLEMLRFFFTNAVVLDINGSNNIAPISLTYIVRLSLPVVLVGFIAALIGNIFQVGFLFTVKPITPDFNRIIPRFGKFFKRALFSAEAGFNLAKSITKVLVIGIIAFLNIRAEIRELSTMVNSPLISAIMLVAVVAFRISAEAAIALLLLSIPDYIFQRRQHRESLKMSRQELKEERKQFEGDPLVRSRLRDRMREIMTRNMLKEVPQADVVITNPTHFAIALDWDRVKMSAPLVLAKGVDQIAAKIRETAKDYSIPIVENKPLAQALFYEVDIGDVIPEKFYEVIAAILAEIYSLSNPSGDESMVSASSQNTLNQGDLNGKTLL